MELKPFLAQIGPQRVEEFAALCRTSVSVLRQISGRHKRIELGFADVLVAVSGGQLTLRELPLTDRALVQLAIREGVHDPFLVAAA